MRELGDRLGVEHSNTIRFWRDNVQSSVRYSVTSSAGDHFGSETTMKKVTNIHEQAVKSLEEHGHLFQQRCLAEIEHACSTYLHLESEEYPVSIGEEHTVIDFIFRTVSDIQLYLVFECKRAHPTYSNWLFPVPSSVADTPTKVLLTSINDKGYFVTFEHELLLHKPKHFASVGVEFSNQAPTHKRSSRAGTIYGACQQAVTGVGGLALEQRQRMQTFEKYYRQYYFPIVVTTANLFMTRYRLWEVDLTNGSVPLDKATTQQVDWVILDFPVREPFQVTRPEESSFRASGPSEKYRRMFKVKSVAIVKGDGIVRFLNQLNLSG